MTDGRHAFRLEIVRQGWLAGDVADPHDTCSHGAIRAVIGGTLVTDLEGEYGISQSALGLLRSIDGRGPATPHSGEFLLCHGCGYPYSNGCGNFGTDWAVALEDGHVLIRDVRHYGATRGVVKFDAEVRISRPDYIREVVGFAGAAHDFYMAAEPRIVPDDEVTFHREFWAEFDSRLEAASRDIHQS